MEREAYDLDEPDSPQKGIEEFLSELGIKIRAHRTGLELADNEKQDPVADSLPVGSRIVTCPDAVGD